MASRSAANSTISTTARCRRRCGSARRSERSRGMNVASPPLFRPPAAKRNKKPLSALGILAALARNPVEIWSDFHFEKPVLIGKTFFGYRAVVSDPAAVRRVFLDNSANYRKDAVQLRVLRPGLGSGLLTADGEAWKMQRRALAPLFSLRQVAAFAPA